MVCCQSETVQSQHRKPRWMVMGSVGAILLLALLTLHWTLALGFAEDGCSGFRHLENGRTFFRYGGLYVTFSCNPGFRIHGYRTSSCVSGQWAREPPLCVAPGCPSPGEILHGSKEVSPDASVVHFTCDSGFRLFGSSLLYCKGKRWNGTVPVCKESDIMSSFQLKQTSLYKPSLGLNPNILPSLKSRFNTVANTAAKETFLKPSLFGVPNSKPFLTGDVSMGFRKPPEDKAAKKHWFDKATTQSKSGTGGPETRPIVRNPVPVVEPLPTPVPAATSVDTTTASISSLTPGPWLSGPTRSTFMATTAINDHETQMPFSLNQVLSTSTKGEGERVNHAYSATHRGQDMPVLSLSGKKDLSMVPEMAGSHSTNINTSSPEISSVVNTSTRSPEMEESGIPYIIKKPIQPSPSETDNISLAAVTVEGNAVFSSSSSPDIAVLQNEPRTSITPPEPFMVSAPPFIPAVNHEPALHKSLTTKADEDFLHSTELPTEATQLAPALDVTEPPDVITTRDASLQLSAKSSTEREHTNMDRVFSDPLDGVGELNDASDRLRTASSSPSSLVTPKNRILMNSSHTKDNATSNQTLDVTADHNLTLTTSEILELLTRKRRPVCPYPPLPAHGTFYFRTIANPAPFQYKHYVQYACYPGYTLANGDVYSFCLQDGQWSGITPMCIEETPCSLNNGGCSQVCRVNEQNRAECHCKHGFLLLEDQRTCRDLDECVEGLHQCQQACENTFGSYRCSCSSGFQLSADRMSCVDIDECLENGGHGLCESGCVNTPGSFHCICPHGHQLAGDGRACVSECPPGYKKQGSDSGVKNSTTEHCIDIDECEQMEQRNQDRVNSCEWKCVNLPGTHHCVCPWGFTQHPDGYHCKDIDECTLRNGGCSHICINQRGGYKCGCPENYRISPYNRRKCQLVYARTVS
ncbi:hypothetical protein NFI96_023738 [Prochilodus magdalenae]|nr:hypothetical protein NFI96_023738 [Prochilodus magdalenae]